MCGVVGATSEPPRKDHSGFTTLRLRGCHTKNRLCMDGKLHTETVRAFYGGAAVETGEVADSGATSNTNYSNQCV